MLLIEDKVKVEIAAGVHRSARHTACQKDATDSLEIDQFARAQLGELLQFALTSAVVWFTGRCGRADVASLPKPTAAVKLASSQHFASSSAVSIRLAATSALPALFIKSPSKRRNIASA